MGYRVMVPSIAFLFVAFGLAPADEKTDDQKIQGVWTYESMEWNGKKLPADQIKASTITFDGDKITIKTGDKVTMAGTSKFDSTKSPKTVDITVTEGEGKGRVVLGIYKLDGDTVTACMNLEGAERPKEFKSTGQSGTTFFVAKRVKK